MNTEEIIRAITNNKKLQEKLSQKDMTELFVVLTDREKDVITRRFGLDGTPEATLEELGKAFDVTRERVRQWEAKALRKLRRCIGSRSDD